MAKNITPQFEIIYDTREQTPWRLTDYQECIAQHRETLDTGDYTIKGIEHLVRVERKASTGELSQNLGKESKRFLAEFQRMTKYPFRFLVCEFPENYIDMFPRRSGIPICKQKYIRMSPKFIRKRLFEWTNLYEIELVFARDRLLAQTATMRIFSSIIQGLSDGKTVEEIRYEITGGNQQDSW